MRSLFAMSVICAVILGGSMAVALDDFRHLAAALTVYDLHCAHLPTQVANSVNIIMGEESLAEAISSVREVDNFYRTHKSEFCSFFRPAVQRLAKNVR